VSLDFLLAFLFIAFGGISFFTMLHLMGTSHTKHGRTLRHIHRLSELLAVLVFAAIIVDDVMNLVESGFSVRGVILLTLGAVLIPLFIVKNLISERYPELRNRLISIGTTVLVIVFVFSAASAIFHYVESREASEKADLARPAVDMTVARELFVTKCSKCHRLDTALSDTHTPEEWQAVVEAMRLKDPTWISEEEAVAIAEFLIHAGASE
jgi:hypothetical protein